jgi:hypothetical protein
MLDTHYTYTAKRFGQSRWPSSGSHTNLENEVCTYEATVRLRTVIILVISLLLQIVK